MRKSAATSHPPVRRPDVCRHHWRLEPQGGPLSKGRCRLCGAEGWFRNAIEVIDWEDQEGKGGEQHAEWN
jgi:hypothetical protein